MSVQTEVEDATAGFCQALGRHDIDAVMSHFDDDGLVLAPGMPPAQGAKAMRDFFDDLVTGGFEQAEMRPVRVQEIGDSAVAEAGTYAMTVRPPGADAVEDHGKYMIVYRRGGDGRLRIWFDMFHSDAGPQA